jgi:multidrug transporter EmrE-like cation transporter
VSGLSFFSNKRKAVNGQILVLSFYLSISHAESGPATLIIVYVLHLSNATFSESGHKGMPSTVHKRVATFSALKTGPRRSFSSLTCPCAHFSFVRVTALPSCGFPVRVTEMSVPPYVVSTFAFLGFLLVCVPLPWHWQARNAGTCLYMIWTGIGCLNVFINSIIWANDAVNYAPIWCDICKSISLISVESRSSTT